MGLLHTHLWPVAINSATVYIRKLRHQGEKIILEPHLFLDDVHIPQKLLDGPLSEPQPLVWAP